MLYGVSQKDNVSNFDTVMVMEVRSVFLKNQEKREAAYSEYCMLLSLKG